MIDTGSVLQAAEENAIMFPGNHVAVKITMEGIAMCVLEAWKPHVVIMEHV